MENNKPSVKHITLTCGIDKCERAAFVQVLVVADQALQKRIDARANAKLREALDKAHKEGEHND